MDQINAFNQLINPQRLVKKFVNGMMRQALTLFVMLQTTQVHALVTNAQTQM